MKNLIFSLSLIFVCMLFVSGCDLAQPQHKGQARQQPVVQEDLPPAAVPQQEEQQEVSPQDAGENTVLVRAEPGLTGRGNYASAGNTSNPMSIISTPISVMFRAQDRLVLQQVDAAMNLYRGEHGRAPATHAEFMEQIIQANNIRLPQLPPGQSYVYDPADGQLKVQRPRDTP